MRLESVASGEPNEETFQEASIVSVVSQAGVKPSKVRIED